MSTTGTHRNAAKHNKHSVDQKLQHSGDISFSEHFGRIREGFVPSLRTRYLYLLWPFFFFFAFLWNTIGLILIFSELDTPIIQLCSRAPLYNVIFGTKLVYKMSYVLILLRWTTFISLKTAITHLMCNVIRFNDKLRKLRWLYYIKIYIKKVHNFYFLD